MIINSNFTDYYDNEPPSHISLIYNRTTTIETDCFKKYRSPLISSSIGFYQDKRSDINLCEHLNQSTRLTFTKVTPMAIGIAGKLYFCVEYENSILGIKKKFFSYEDLKSVFTSPFIKRNFDMYNTGQLLPYCQRQFRCVNFVMWMDETLHLIKEPNLQEMGLDKLESSNEIYNNINKFLKNQVEDNKKYAKKPKTQYEKRGFVSSNKS